MKKPILTTIAIFFLYACLAGASYAQSNCDEVKKENEYLKKSLKMLEPVMTQTVDNTEIRLTKCTGDPKAQTITMEFILINKQANKEVILGNPTGIDMEGNEYNTNYQNFQIGSKTNGRAVLNTDVPIKASASLKKVLPAVKYLKLIKFLYRSENTKYPGIDIEFRDIQVTWK